LLLYLGTGVYQTSTTVASRTSFSTGLPDVLAADLISNKKDRKLICGNRNRGARVASVP
jgi:hypothetical protein